MKFGGSVSVFTLFKFSGESSSVRFSSGEMIVDVCVCGASWFFISH